MSGIITEIDKYVKGWHGGLPETPCGFGSRLSETTIQRKWIPEVVAKYDIRSIADIGAGDLNWVGRVGWLSEVEYQAYDLVPRHGSVLKFDLIKDIPDSVDCIMCLWVLNHMPEDHARQALANLKASGSKYLMYTWWPAMFAFLDLGYIESAVIRSRIKAEIRLVEC